MCSTAEQETWITEGSSAREAPGEHRDPRGTGSSYVACARPGVMMANPSSQSRHPGRQVVVWHLLSREDSEEGHSMARSGHVKSTSNQAPFCGHLHRSGALLPPDCQGRMVGTDLGAKAAALTGICTICPDRGQCLHTQGC